MMNRQIKSWTLGGLLLGLLAPSACSSPAGENSASPSNTIACTGKCDAQGGDFYDSLQDRDEAVAQYLEVAASKDGKLEGDYRTFLDGVGQTMGCGPETEKTFTILLSNKSHFPRNITTLCSDSPRKANKMFVSTQSDNGDLTDVDGHDIKVAVWDGEADKYNLYEIRKREGEDVMTVEVEPAKCATCHAAPADLPVAGEIFVPIMNELTNPWTLWNAEPQFRSHRFDDLIDPVVAEAPVYSSMIEGDRLGGASDFETITRAAFDQVAKARLDSRREEASLDSSLRLLQPLFCEEAVNYASENHEANQIQTDVFIDPSVREMLVEINGYEWEQDFVHEDRFRFGAPADGEARVEVMPVRGAYSVAMDTALVSRRVLTAEQVLRLRALDWKRPVFSDFRCDLFRDGAQRLRANPPELGAYETNSDLAPVLFEQIMTLDGEVTLAPADEGRVIAIDVVDDAALESLRGAGVESYEVTFDAFATEVDEYVSSFAEEGARSALEAERQRRGCAARARFASAPAIPDLSCE